MSHFEFSHLSDYVPQILAALPVASAVVIGALLLEIVLGRALKLLADKTSLTHEDVAPFRRIGRWVIYGAATALVLGVFGFNLGGVWAVLATIVGMVAIGFVAVWSVLSNTLCTFMILIFRPFAIGDDIEFVGDTIGGRVVDLNFVFTTVRATDGSVMQIPNNLFFQRILKRKHGAGAVSLARQLQAREAAQV